MLSMTVDTLIDENNGIGVGAGNSLREVIFAAAAGETIDFSVIGTINLSLGELVINKDLTINGPGAALLTIDASGNDPTPMVNNGDGSRVFSVFGAVGVSISGLTLTGGDAGGSGGAISNSANLTISALTISGNSAGTTSTGFHGGGISHSSGNLTINASQISGNSSTLGRGGGIYSRFGSVTMTESTISGNAAGVGSAGGGIYSSYSTTTIDSSTISGNSATTGGGLALAGYNIATTVTNSTISGNFANINGGGVAVLVGELFLRHSTVTANRSDSDNNGTGSGGGVMVSASFSQASADHTIVSGNLRGNSTPEDVVGAMAAQSSLIGHAAPRLGPLANNGGPTMTHALLTDSPAIDAGDPNAVAGVGGVPAFDQRGNLFTRVSGGRIDVGAYERQTLAGLNLVVDTLVDESDGNYGVGDLSLREAIGLANGSVGADTVAFAASLTSGGPAEILLTQGELRIVEALTINGPGADLLTIDASGNDPTPTVNNGDGSRVFHVDDGTASAIAVSISGLALTGGDMGNSGGAIRNAENLTITNSTISGNSAGTTSFGFYGGGIAHFFGNLTVTASTISGNSTFGRGGGIYSEVSLTITGSTINQNIAALGGGIFNNGYLSITGTVVSGNTADFDGGGIYSSGVSMVINSTISGNSADDGGGIRSRYDNLTITNSTISGNSAIDEGGGISSWFGSLDVVNSRISGNQAGRGGGGVHGRYGDLAITSSTISDNEAGYGGGIQGRGGTVTMTITDSTISGNSGGGIGVFDGTLMIANSMISDNTRDRPGSNFDFGGGIAVADADVTISGSTISGNFAGDGGGGIATYLGGDVTITGTTISGNSSLGRGGGVFNGGDAVAITTVWIIHSTITNNDASLSGGGVASLGNTSTFTRVHSSIIAGNTSDNAGTEDVQFVSGFVNSIFSHNGYNLVGFGNATGNFNQAGDQTGVANPILGPLVNNGGPTLTHALLAGSPAIDTGSAGFTPPPDFDQRGDPWLRVYNGTIDKGAFERQPNPLPGDYNFDGSVNAADYTVWRNTLGSTNDLRADGSGAMVGVPDGVVDGLDYDFWKAKFGNVLGAGGGAGNITDVALSSTNTTDSGFRPQSEGEGSTAGQASSGTRRFDVADASGKRPAEPVAVGRVHVSVRRRDDALLAWLARRGDTSAIDEGDGVVEREPNVGSHAGSDAVGDILDEVFAGIGRSPLP
jgi:hypothetical protein